MAAGRRLVKQGRDRRAQMLRFIKSYTRKHGYAPTISEIGAAVGVASPNAVRNHLLKMEEEGLISMTPKIARSIRVLEKV
jgi:repressor LexA